MTYAESLRFLFDLLDAQRHPRPGGREDNLVRAGRLLARLGDPQRRLRTVLVAGTKGKGSTATMLAAIEAATGRRVGVYTKPHLVDYRERLRVDGRLISEGELAALVAEVRPAVEAGAADPEGMPTYFEVSVALALLYFLRRAVDLALLEVGLGGRRDATNICDPILSVITPISYDHVELLGRTLAAIAREKAGIIRAGRAVVIAPQPAEADAALQAACAETGARLVRAADRVRWTIGEMTPAGQRLWLSAPEEGGWVDLPLVGRHQAVNAATAVAAATELEAAGFALSAAAVRRGLEGLYWPARVEVLAEEPTVIVDVAHNVASMQALRDALLEVWPGRRLILVFGMVATHDPAGPAAVIAPLADVVITTRPEHVQPLPAAALAETVRPYAPAVEVEEDRDAAVARALALAGPADVICITGSFFLAGVARARLLRAAQEVTAGSTKHNTTLVRRVRVQSSSTTGSPPDSGL